MKNFRQTNNHMFILVFLGCIMFGCKSKEITIPDYAEYQKIFNSGNPELEFRGHKIKEQKKMNLKGNIYARFYMYKDKDGKVVYHGLCTRYDEQGRKRYEQLFFEGMQDGYFICWDEKGYVIVQGIYKKDAPWDGTFFHPHSDKAIFTYKDGNVIKYEDNKGNVFAEGTWSNGKPWNGSFFDWDDNIEYYRDGKLLEKKKIEDVAMQFKYYRNKKEADNED